MSVLLLFYFFRKSLKAIATAPQSSTVAAIRTISTPVFINTYLLKSSLRTRRLQ